MMKKPRFNHSREFQSSLFSARHEVEEFERQQLILGGRIGGVANAIDAKSR
jgi:hypothetical protein